MNRIHIVSDFNAGLAARYLNADSGSPSCEAVAAPFGQLYASLVGEPPAGADFGFVWSRPEVASSAYGQVLQGQSVPQDAILAQVDEFAAALTHFAAQFRAVFVASWTRTHVGRGLGMLEWSSGGHALLLAKMNVRLAEALGKTRGVYLLDAARWLETTTVPPYDSKYWFAMKSPFTEPVFKAAASDVKAAIRGCLGQGRKLVIVDLDDTIWGGIVGDIGWQELRLGGHDHVGEAYVDFQRALKELTSRGIQVALVSKNDEGLALEAIDRHPEMVLRRSDFAGWRINWNDKAQNVLELVKELNLGLHSVVFIDDNPGERGRVREAFPEIFVPEWPKDPVRFAETLRMLDCFDQPRLTEEDRARTRMYADERERRQMSASFSSMEEWLRALGIMVQVACVSGANLKRAVQLMNKTSQMNLSNRRMTEPEFLRWLDAASGREAYALTVSDRFGQLGLTGVISWQRNGESLDIVDFILSCRAFGRKVEETMLHIAVEAAGKSGLSEVTARVVPTKRNRPCLEFWAGSGCAETEQNVFVWKTEQAYPLPVFVKLSEDFAAFLPSDSAATAAPPTT